MTTPITGIVGVDLATGTEKAVATFAEAGLPGSGFPGLAMSPDGTTLAVMAWVDGLGTTPRPARIFSVGVDGASYREISGSFRARNTANQMRWTPDGRSIVFSALDTADKWRLMRVAAEGGQAEFDGLDFGTLSPLLSGLRMTPGSFINLDLSPDGTQCPRQHVDDGHVRALDARQPAVGGELPIGTIAESRRNHRQHHYVGPRVGPAGARPVGRTMGPASSWWSTSRAKGRTRPFVPISTKSCNYLCL